MESETPAAAPPPDNLALQRLATWRQRVTKELAAATPAGGTAPAFETLRTPLREGFAIEPLYVSASYAAHVAAARTELVREPPSADDVVVDLRVRVNENAAEQLAAGLLWLVSVARDESIERVVVQVPVGVEILRETAKLRALRRVAARMFELVGGGPALVVHAFTAFATAADLATNLIGNSASVFAAVTGGADAVTPLAHSAAPDHARLADNVARLALHEAHLDAVSDPAAGSYALESLTDELSAAAWAKFQRVFSATAKTQEANR